MNMLLAIAVVFALALDAPKGMQPRVLMGDSSHCDAVMVRNGHLSIEEVCLTSTDGRRKEIGEVAWDGHVVAITQADEKASAGWIRSHSLLSRLTTQHHDLYWDGKKVNLGKVDIFDLYEAIPFLFQIDYEVDITVVNRRLQHLSKYPDGMSGHLRDSFHPS